jgi:hypothetical protein
MGCHRYFWKSDPKGWFSDLERYFLCFNYSITLLLIVFAGELVACKSTVIRRVQDQVSVNCGDSMFFQ